MKENARSQSVAIGLGVLFFTLIKIACNRTFEEYYFTLVSVKKYGIGSVKITTGHPAALDD